MNSNDSIRTTKPRLSKYTLTVLCMPSVTYHLCNAVTYLLHPKQFNAFRPNEKLHEIYLNN